MSEKLICILNPDFLLKNESGSFVQLVHCNWNQVNVIRSPKGCKRGGHYHKENQEAFYIIEGTLELTLEKDNFKENHVFTQGDFFSITPFAKHDFNFVEDTIMVSLYDKGVEFDDGTKDIYTS